MKIELHDAQKHCLYAAGSFSDAAWASGLYADGSNLQTMYLKSAREQLALALEQLDAYEATLAKAEAA